jgi:molybdopterin converting factor small subunit
MKIKVSLFLSLGRFSPEGKRDFEVDLDRDSTIESLLSALAIPFHIERVILVNGRHATPETLLSHSDHVTMFPPMSGG